jgi:ferredoxin
MTVIVGQDTCAGAGQSVVVAPELVDQRDEEDTVMLQQQLLPAKRGERVREVARRWRGPTIRLDES